MIPTAPASVREEAVTTVPAWRVEVWRRSTRDDPEGEAARAALVELGHDLAPGSVRVARGYLLSPRFDERAVRRITASLLADPVVDEARVTPPDAPPAPTASGRRRILVMRQPGVMDPVARTLEEILVRDGLGPGDGPPGVATFRAYELACALSRRELEEAARRLFANETIEIVRVDREDLPYGGTLPAARRGRVEVSLLEADDDELARVSADGGLSLNLAEMRAIRDHFRGLGRQPTACELETLAQTWSEHCKHKTLTGVVEFTAVDGSTERIDNLLKSTIVRATRELDRPFCVSVFVDNAGIVEFDQGWDAAIKVETHNHPSAIDPYGGAGTGIGGVIRDVLGAGLGARPIANTDCFFVGPPDLPREEVPKGTMHPRRILRGVVAGVRDYGNRMGIPTVSGGVWFDEGYVANPLVYAGTVGLLPRDCATKEVRPGDRIVAVGGRTGRDGIHGATFSSVELSEHSESVSSAAVQIGDPITEKRVLDCLLQARDAGLYRAVTDCGAGGFSSAIGEMGETCGADVDLRSVPLKYPGLSSHEIWISEAQERMVLAVPPEHVDACLATFAAEDVEATVVGTFTDTGRLVVRDAGEVVAELDMGFLHGGCPRPVRRAVAPAPSRGRPGCPAPASWEETLLALLAAPDIASKEWIVRQYDHEVQGTSVVKPLVGARGDGPSDAAVLAPLASSTKGLAISCGASPRYGRLDAGAMTLAAIDEALRNAIAVGADPDHAVLLDNFSWGNCDRPEQLGALVQAAKACYDGALAFGAPFVSGKDSLNNEYRVGDERLSIPPTLLITCLARVPDVRRAVTMDWKRAGSSLYLVGATREELGGSHYLGLVGLAGGRVPRPDLARAPRLLRALHAALSAGTALACHDLAEGGLLVAAAEMAFAGGLGARIDLGALPVEPGPLEPGPGEPGPEDARGGPVDPDALRAFSESCTRFLVEVAPDSRAAFEAALRGLPVARIGEVTAEPTLTVLGADGTTRLALPVERLRRAFLGGFAG